MFSEDDSWNIFKLLAAILHIGNLEFEGTHLLQTPLTRSVLMGVELKCPCMYCKLQPVVYCTVPCCAVLCCLALSCAVLAPVVRKVDNSIPGGGGGLDI